MYDRAVPSWLIRLWQDRIVGRAVFLCGLVLLFALSLLLDMHFSATRSRLAMPPAYDDVVYLKDAMRRYVFDLHGGIRGLWAGLLNDPPHAPFSTLTAIGGFQLFGPKLASAYLASGWILAVYIAAMAWISRPLQGVAPRLLFVAALLFARVSQAMVTEFRPDMAAGLLFGLALLGITRTDFASAGLGRRALVVPLAVLATIAKPSGVVLVVPGLGIALALSIILQARAGRAPWPKLVGAALLPVIGYFILLAPFALLYGQQTFDYIDQALVTNSDVWRTGGGPLIHWTYHLFGYGATKALLPFNVIGLIFIAIDIGRLRRADPGNERTAAFSLYGTIAVLYVAMALSAEKSPYQGSYFYLPFLFASAIAAARVLAAIRPAWHATAGLAVLVVVLAFARPYGSAYSGLPPHAAELPPLYDRLTERISDFVAARRTGDACPGVGPLLLATSPEPITPEAIELDLFRRGQELDIGETYLARSSEEIDRLVSRSDLVLIADPALPQLKIALPGFAFVPALIEKLGADPAWQREKIGEVSGLPVWLFVRSACRTAS